MNHQRKNVALRKESVDRNGIRYRHISFRRVALRKESVDRNTVVSKCALLYRVALRKESVDRNTDPINLSDIPPKSLSARRAWIEIYVI